MHTSKPSQPSQLSQASDPARLSLIDSCCKLSQLSKEEGNDRKRRVRLGKGEVAPFGGDYFAYRWIVARVPVRNEFAAAILLRRRGFVTLMPTEQRLIRRSRWSKAKEPLPVEFPLLAGYAIVGLTVGQTPEDVWHTGLVRYVVGSMVDGERRANTLRPIPLELLVNRYGDGSVPTTLVHEQAQVPWPVEAGKPAKVKAGPFAGQQVAVERVSGVAAKILLPLFGGSISVTMGIDNLAACEQPSRSDDLRSVGKS